MKTPTTIAAITALLAGLFLGAPTSQAEPASAPAGLTIDRVALLMRHGARSPDHEPPTSPGVAAQPWPAWPVKPGWLTDHGAAAITIVADYDRRLFTADGLLPAAGCPAAGSVEILSNSLERTIVTAATYAAALTPGCGQLVEHQPQDTPDPLFPWHLEQSPNYDPAKANAEFLAALGPGGAADEVALVKSALTRLDDILCGVVSAGCGVSSIPSTLHSAAPGKSPYISGGFSMAAEPAQDLVLEYASGLPMSQVGWGRANAADITAISAITAEQFRLGSRPHQIAKLDDGPIQAKMLTALTGENGARITVIVAHDGNIAALGGLLGLHWQVPGLAPDYPLLGSAIGFERLSDAKGKHYVRAIYRAQNLDQIRSLTPLDDAHAPYFAVLPIAGCHAHGVAGLCTLDEFNALMR